MTVIAVTANSVYLLDTKAHEFSRRVIANERTPAEKRNQTIALGALDDDVWQPYDAAYVLDNGCLWIDLPGGKFVRTSVLDDPEAITAALQEDDDDARADA